MKYVYSFATNTVLNPSTQSAMRQYSTLKLVFYHLYPGVIITIFFILTAPILVERGLPPQLSMLIAIALVVIPILVYHLISVRNKENKNSLSDLIPYRQPLAKGKLIGYTIGLIVFAFLVYGLTQPVNAILTDKLLFWLPDWYKVQDFEGYSRNIIIITLILNLILNGFLAPFVEEVYFRGYLLPRMERLGILAPILSAVLFSVYHFWQPQIYLTLMIALLPMTYLTWKTKSLKLAVYTHCGLNLVGALLSFAMINR